MSRKKDLKQDLKKDLQKIKNVNELKMAKSDEQLVAAVNASNDEKASTFLDAINKYAKEQSDKIYTEANLRKEEELKKAENEVLNDAYNLIQHEIAINNKKMTSKISQAEIAGRKQLFEKRNNIIEKVFDKASDKLVSFTKSDDYQNLLVSYAKVTLNVLNESGTVIYLNSNDMKYASIIEKALGSNYSVEIKEADDILIGGLRGFNETMGLVVDETLDSKLKEQYSWFQRNSGLYID